MTDGPGDAMGTVIEERVVLAKFDGEASYDDIASGAVEPVETTTIVNGEIVEHWVKEV